MSYSTDLADQQWAVIEPLLPKAKEGGRPRTTNIRRVCDAIFYLVKTGCHWRLLPSDFPPWRTVYEYFKNWRAAGVWRKIQNTLVKKVRRREHKKSYPTIAIIDSQSVKTGKMVSEDKGYDGGKHVKGRKRHLAVDILGLPIGVHVTSANTHDKVGGKTVLLRAKKFMRGRKLKKIYADGGYGGEPFRQFVRKSLGAMVWISKGIHQKVKRFVPVKKRWVVERTNAWFGDYRRLDKDQERLVKNSEAMIRVAAISMMLKKLFPAPVW
ncbi:MAG: IS5 family transposase [Rhizomicrobium sp.]|nr:IS5 family transposase [Rhizomicrobium sp.]